MIAVTADTITEAQIYAILWSLPRDHYARQWCRDALVPSASHPDRQRNAKRLCAEMINTIREVAASWTTPCDDPACACNFGENHGG